MVSTRNHPSNFPPPDLSPSKALTRSPRTSRKNWVHTPSRLTLLWLIISLPLVFWDIGYVLLRPHSMPGGWLHSPIWTPYALYGTIDYIYGEKAWNERNGFTAAQTSLNVVESVGYVGYLWVVWRFGEGETRALAGGWGGVACLTGFALSVMTVSKTLLYGEYGHFATLPCDWALSKEDRADEYEGANEFFSGFENIGHNDLFSLTFLWIVPK